MQNNASNLSREYDIPLAPIKDYTTVGMIFLAAAPIPSSLPPTYLNSSLTAM